jgi:hypothetical protein
MRAIGLGKVSDTDQLIGGNLGIKLSVKTGEYAGNEIKGYRALNGAAPTPVSILSTPSSVKTASAKAAPPWAKK